VKPSPRRPSAPELPAPGPVDRWPLAPLRRSRRGPWASDGAAADDVDPGGGALTAWSWRFPCTPAELEAARRGPERPPTGVLVLGTGPVAAPDGSSADGPLCVPVSVPVVLVAPPVTGRALVRSWGAQEAVAGSAPQVAHVGSLARARALPCAGDALLVVVEGTGECWARRPHRPGERVSFVPWLVAPDPDPDPDPTP